MTWNYRILVKPDTGTARLIEVYYDDDGLIYGWCKASLDTDGTEADIRDDLTAMQAAFEAPVLTDADLPDFKKDTQT